MKVYEFGEKPFRFCIRSSAAVPGTTVHCFYAAKMGEEYLRRYQKHFANPVIHNFDMEHEQWTEKVKEVCL